MTRTPLKLVTPDMGDERPQIDPPVTTTGGAVQDIIAMPPEDRDRVSRIWGAATAIKPLAGSFTTRSARVLAAKHLDNIITHATALRAALPQ
jgi:hypothetical protein